MHAEAGMSDTTTHNPHKEEDEGYLAAEAGRGLSDNSYPFGTIRYEHWRRGWRIRTNETRRAVPLGQGQGEDDEGYLAAAAGKNFAENPYPSGTLRYDDWRRGWCIRNEETQRAFRLKRATEG
jgi:hypothetical protein